MKHSSMINKKLLGVCGRAEILQTLEDKIKNSCRKCRFDKAETAGEASRLMMFFGYHLVIVDEQSFKNFPRSGPSLIQNFPLVILTDNGKLPVDQQTSFAPNVYGYIPVNHLDKTIPVISLLLNIEFVPPWQSLFKLYGGIFNLGTVEAADKLFISGMKPPPRKMRQGFKSYKITRPAYPCKLGI